jgi:hypothetical protein
MILVGSVVPLFDLGTYGITVYGVKRHIFWTVFNVVGLSIAYTLKHTKTV